MSRLISEYEDGEAKTLEDIVDFHARFEKTHPFQDGNGRVGRLIMFKKCLRFGLAYCIDLGIFLPHCEQNSEFIFNFPPQKGQNFGLDISGIADSLS